MNKENSETIVYVCYVQNYLGIMDGEDVVSNMRVYAEQSGIDKWFSEQISEGKEMGFEPEMMLIHTWE